MHLTLSPRRSKRQPGRARKMASHAAKHTNRKARGQATGLSDHTILNRTRCHRSGAKTAILRAVLPMK